MKVRYIGLCPLSRKINLRRKLRADIYVILKFVVGNDERESDLCRRPGGWLFGVPAPHCEPVRSPARDYCTCFGFRCLRDGRERITRAPWKICKPAQGS